MKVLIQSDSPLAPTGFGKICAAIAHSFYMAGWDVAIVAMNHKYSMIHHSLPYQIYGLLKEIGDPYGANLCKALYPNCDLFLIINDIEIADLIVSKIDHMASDVNEEGVLTSKPIVFYFPVDTDYANSIALKVMEDAKNMRSFYGIQTLFLTMSEVGFEIYKDIAKKQKVNLSWSYPPLSGKEFVSIDDKKAAEKEFREKLRLTSDCKVVLNVNRHTARKNIVNATVKAMALSQQKVDSVGYLHCKVKDFGGDLISQMKGILDHPLAKEVLKKPVKIFFDKSLNFQNNIGNDEKAMSKLYAAADLVVSSSFGEGFGYSTIEAMAARTPVLLPRNTASAELGLKGGGFFIEQDYTFESIKIEDSTSNLPRFEVDVKSMSKGIISALKSKDIQERIELGYAFAKTVYENDVTKLILEFFNYGKSFS